MSNTTQSQIYFSLRDYADGYRGYWLNEQPDSEVWKLGYFWDGCGPERATRYATLDSAMDAFDHFKNRDANFQAKIEVRAPSVIELVAHLYSIGFKTVAVNGSFRFQNGLEVIGRVMQLGDTTCFIYSEKLLSAVGVFDLLKAFTPAETQGELFNS